MPKTRRISNSYGNVRVKFEELRRVVMSQSFITKVNAMSVEKSLKHFMEGVIGAVTNVLSY